MVLIYLVTDHALPFLLIFKRKIVVSYIEFRKINEIKSSYLQTSKINFAILDSITHQ